MGDRPPWLQACDPKNKLATLDLALRERAVKWLKRMLKILPSGWGVRITHGLRTAEEQNLLFQKGRKKDLETGKWVIVDRGLVVTYRDGYNKKSNHQDRGDDGLAEAFDFVLLYHGRAIWYPRGDDETWDAQETRQLYQIAVEEIRKQGLVTGADWKGFFDLYHAELPRRKGK